MEYDIIKSEICEPASFLVSMIATCYMVWREIIACGSNALQRAVKSYHSLCLIRMVESDREYQREHDNRRLSSPGYARQAVHQGSCRSILINAQRLSADIIGVRSRNILRACRISIRRNAFALTLPDSPLARRRDVAIEYR